LDAKYIVKISGKEHVTYDGLLDEAHKQGLVSMQVDVIQKPLEENNWTTICSATASFNNGSLFSEIGDANPKNCNAKIAVHSIRMAATRAKARALRDALNIKGAAFEELGGDDYHPVSAPKPPAVVPPMVTLPKTEMKVSQAQLRRLFAMITEQKVNHIEVKERLQTLYGVESSKDLLVSEYDDFIENHLSKMGNVDFGTAIGEPL
jgi:hypothetical protein